MTAETPQEAGERSTTYKVCQSLTAEGKACCAPAREGRAFCLFHDPAADSREIIALARKRGGQAAMAKLEPVSILVDFSSAEGAAATLQRAAEEVLAGRLDSRRSNALGYLAAQVLRARADWGLEERLAKIEAALGEEAQDNADREG